MKKLLLLLTIAISINSYAQIGGLYNHRLNTVFDSLCNKYNIKGASAAIYIPGDGMWERSYGVSHGSTPITSDMYMGIGSNTKTFTAVLMLKLQEQGKLDLDDTIGQWIQHPNIPGNITIRQMLNHTSGLYSFTFNTDINNFITPPYTQIWSPDTTLSLVKAPVAAPGGSWDYCNTNYLLAGIIIRDVMGQPFEKTLRDEILTPNGLNETYFFPYEKPNGTIPHAWSSVLSSGNAMEDMDVAHNYSHNAFLSLAYSAGSIMSTARDNAMFWHKLVSGQMLTTRSMTELETLVPVSPGQGYGLGIFKLSSFNGRSVISHGGTGFGFINDNIADQTSKVSISVLTNQDSISNSMILGGVIKALHQITMQHTNVNNISIERNIKVYPNPAKGQLNINIEKTKNAVATIYDIKGQTIKQQPLQTDQNTIHIPDVPNGMYLLNITEGGTSIHRQTIQIHN